MSLEFEPVPGLPEVLPKGERMVWQGSPGWRSLAKTAFRVKEVGVYFGLLMVWRAVSTFYSGGSAQAALTSVLWAVAMMAIAMAILCGLAWLSAKTTIYTITDRRIVMRYGTALPLAVNLPFNVIESAALGKHADGTGDIPMVLKPGVGLGYMVLWPNARPWHYSKPQPMLRALSNPEQVARLLSDRLREFNAMAPAMMTAGDAANAGPQRSKPASGSSRPAMAS